MNPYYLYQRLTRDYTNFSLYHHRRLDAHLVSMHQSGTNWVKHLLSMVLVREFGLPEPDDIHDNRIVTHPRTPTPFPGIPKIAQSHNIPSPLLAWLAGSGLAGLPKIILIIRDLRVVLESHYRKYETRYRVPFSEYLRVPSSNKKFSKNIWWDFRFLNSWSSMLQHMPDRILVVKYENLCRNTTAEVQRMLDFLGIKYAQGTLDFAVASSSKEIMKRKDTAPKDGFAVVRTDRRPAMSLYTADDKAYFKGLCRKYLRDDFGYDYQNW